MTMADIITTTKKEICNGVVSRMGFVNAATSMAVCGSILIGSTKPHGSTSIVINFSSPSDFSMAGDMGETR